MPNSCIFIDRDGTINEDIGYVSTPEQLSVYPWTAQAIRLINEAGVRVVVVTNQSGIARGFYTEDVLRAIHQRLIEELARQGARLDAVYYCPHHPRIGNPSYRRECDCRKPKPGMLQRAAREHGINLSRSWVIGDKSSDVNLAAAAGAHSALVLTGYGLETSRNRESWPCEPDLVAENLLDAVNQIIERSISSRR
jgi:D-glycero-D-manno-heptose 1,7-bisphosphate phosphatase